MNSQHTPGPWKQDGNAVHTTRGAIALCPVPQKGGVFDCNANARLIAAAPDMIAALKGILKAETARPRPTLMPDYLRAIEGAIAKAEGRTE